MNRRGLALGILPWMALVGCGSSSDEPPATLVIDGGIDGTQALPNGGDSPAADGASSAPDGATDDGAGSAPDGAAGSAVVDTTPITGAQPDTWTWVPFDDAFCRDGTTTGIALNVHPGATQLMIYLEGGGACFNEVTCLDNPSHFDEQSFLALTSDAGVGGTDPGIFGRTDPANPVKDWSYVYVPYCTGDVHAGDNPNGTVAGVLSADGGPETQVFVGYRNLGYYLARVVPTFPGVTQVLLTGISAGGFGAAANYLRVAKAFGSVPVYLLDDSGPPMDAPYIAPCESSAWVSTWSLDQTILADCGSDCSNDGHYLIDYVKHAVTAYPAVPFGLLESTDDGTITEFFGFGAMDCTEYVQETADDFSAGLQDIRTQLAANTNFGAYIFSGTRHTTLESTADFDTQTVPGADGGTVLLTDWISALVAGQVTNVGP
ncbi:MAG TPA: pectin acetylesterase-family hydrolase [Polyangiaceae bacterium]|nr:pectin acetylesterase-family hydrolase [Polyangiaceae bacterium]